MAVDQADIVLRLSVAAAAGDTTAGTLATSLGDQCSTTLFVSGNLHNLFDQVSSAEAAAGDVEYRCVFALNNDGLASLTSAYVQLQAETAGGSSILVGLDPIGVTAKGAAGAQAATVANENTAPAGVTFGAGPLSIGTLAPGQVIGVWVKRTTVAGALYSADSATLRVGGETLP